MTAPGMMFQDLFTQELPVDVRVYLRCRDLLMPQHLLNGAEIVSTFQQMSRKGMAERVGTDILLDASHFHLLFDDMKNHDT